MLCAPKAGGAEPRLAQPTARGGSAHARQLGPWPPGCTGRGDAAQPVQTGQSAARAALAAPRLNSGRRRGLPGVAAARVRGGVARAAVSFRAFRRGCRGWGPPHRSGARAGDSGDPGRAVQPLSDSRSSRPGGRAAAGGGRRGGFRAAAPVAPGRHCPPWPGRGRSLPPPQAVLQGGGGVGSAGCLGPDTCSPAGPALPAVTC